MDAEASRRRAEAWCEPFHEEEWERCTADLQAARTADEEALQARARAERDLEDLTKRHIRFMELEEQRLSLQRESERLSKLQSCLRGNAFVEYIAEEQLMQVSQSASQRLRYLTKQRYSLEVDSGGGFVIRDDANGGVRRPVSTLSGGETFLPHWPWLWHSRHRSSCAGNIRCSSFPRRRVRHAGSGAAGNGHHRP